MNSFYTPNGFISQPTGLDWKFISSIYPSDLLLNHDKYTMKLIIQDFLNTQSFDNIPNNATTNLLFILQIIMKRLLENNKRTQKKLENQIKINEKLRIKIQQQNSGDSDDEFVKDIMDNTIINKSKMSGVICPVCLNCYTSLKYLDRHFFTHHCELSDLWQILRTPHYSGITEDPTIKLIATSSEKNQLKQTIQFLGEEVILEQRDNDMKIKDYFRKKLMKVNNKLDQISSNMTQKSFDNYHKSSSHSNNNFIIKENSSIASKTDLNKYNSSNNNYTDYDLNTSHKSTLEIEDEIVIQTNSKNSNENDTNNYSTNNNNNNNNNINSNMNMNNTNYTTSTNVFVISDSTLTENETELKNKTFSTPMNNKTNTTSVSSFQLSPSNFNSTPNNRIESNMFPMTNYTFINSANLRTISEESSDGVKPIKQTKIKSRKKERIKKAVLETDESTEG